MRLLPTGSACADDPVASRADSCYRAGICVRGPWRCVGACRPAM